MMMRAQTIPERIVHLEVEANGCKEFRTDVEKRLRRIELQIHLATGAVMLLQLVLKFVL